MSFYMYAQVETARTIEFLALCGTDDNETLEIARDAQSTSGHCLLCGKFPDRILLRLDEAAAAGIKFLAVCELDEDNATCAVASAGGGDVANFEPVNAEGQPLIAVELTSCGESVEADISEENRSELINYLTVLTELKETLGDEVESFEGPSFYL